MITSTRLAFSGMHCSTLKSAFVFLFIVSRCACQQMWGASGFNPGSFGASQMLLQNWQPGQGFESSPLQQMASLMPAGQQFSSGGSRLNAGGKIQLLTTLFGGLRNTGLERTIAGEVLQRLIKTTLKEIVVPFKRNTFFNSGS